MKVVQITHNPIALAPIKYSSSPIITPQISEAKSNDNCLGFTKCKTITDKIV